MIGFEFFAINRYIPHLLDIAIMRFVFEIELRDERDEWFLDYTNPNGESLVTGASALKSYILWINDGRVPHEDIPIFYHTLRRREYDWQFYMANGTSHAAIIGFLDSWSKGCHTDESLLTIFYRLGLMHGHGLTLAGESLVGRCCRSKSYEYA